MDLEKCAYDEEYNKSVGVVFATYAPFFKIYAQYIDKCERAHELVLKEKTANRLFRDFCSSDHIFSDAKYRSQGSQSIESYLIMPVQRIPRYK